MSGSLNKVLLIGRLTRDPEMRYTPSGQAVSNFSLATDDTYVGKDGQKVEKAEFHRITTWGKQAEFCGNYLGKGRLVYIEGKIETRKWQDQNGQDRYSTEIKAVTVQALDKKPDGQCGQQRSAQPTEQYNANDDMDGAPF